MRGAYMKLQARVGRSADTEETGPKLTSLRNRLLNRESASADTSTEVRAGEMNPACVPDGGTPEGRQGSMTEKDSIATESGFELSYSVAKAFEPIKAWQDRGVAELAACLESLEPMEQSAAAALGPINALCEHMRKLSNAFAPLRTFEEQLGVLAESFAPMKAMHQEIALMVEDSGALFIQLAKSLEVVNVSRKRIAKLASTLETAAEIQTELNELAQAFNRTSPGTPKTVQNAA
jgi:methyl-accepting chemotaxis protein